MSSAPTVTMNVMMAIHCKKTVSVDLRRPLKEYIRKYFSDRDMKDSEDDLQAVQEMRSEMERGTSASLDARKDLLVKYFKALTVMASRFPINPDSENLSIPFTWFDAFSQSKKSTQSNIHFERAAVAFNLGATFSQLALSADRSSAAGLKGACANFQLAAGAFAFVRDQLAAKAASAQGTIDLRGETVGMLERLMLAQAQECFYEKALGDGKPNALCSRIAQQAGMFYEETNAALQLPPLSQHFDKAWVANVAFKARHFAAEALYRLCLDLHEREEIAEEVSRLRATKSILQDARKNSKGVLQPLMDSLYKLEGNVDRNLQRAESENDRVYLMRVPAFGSLPPIAAAQLVSASLGAVQEMVDATGERLFEGLVPEGSAKELSRYTDMVDSLIRTQVERMQQESELAKVKLREMGLPDALQAQQGNPSALVPQKLREDVEAVMISGGPTGLPAELAQLLDLRRVNEEMLVNVEDMLDKEAAQDASIRQQFGSKWARPQSSTLTASLRERIRTFAGNVKQAKESDGRIERDMKESQELMHALAHTRVEDALPRLSRPMVSVGDDHALVAQLQQGMNELEKIGAQRAGLEDMLRSMKAKENILPQMMNAMGSREDLFKKELSKYDPIVKEVESNVVAQRQTMQRLEAQFQAFSSAFNFPEYKRDVDRSLKRMEAAVHKYQEVRSNLNEGLKFYVQLQDAITALKQQCSDFVMTRNIQKQDLVDELQRQLSGLSVAGKVQASSSSAPASSYSSSSGASSAILAAAATATAAPPAGSGYPTPASHFPTHPVGTAPVPSPYPMYNPPGGAPAPSVGYYQQPQAAPPQAQPHPQYQQQQQQEQQQQQGQKQGPFGFLGIFGGPQKPQQPQPPAPVQQPVPPQQQGYQPAPQQAGYQHQYAAPPAGQPQYYQQAAAPVAPTGVPYHYVPSQQQPGGAPPPYYAPAPPAAGQGYAPPQQGASGQWGHSYNPQPYPPPGGN